jgi:hypothetical protein
MRPQAVAQIGAKRTIANSLRRDQIEVELGALAILARVALGVAPHFDGVQESAVSL